jgi:uncharacterized protein Yka (UPF0111/DUF47 family)
MNVTILLIDYLLLLLTFVTPIDRGNIPKLSGSINEVLDSVDVTSDRFLFRIVMPRAQMKELTNVSIKVAKEMIQTVTKWNKICNSLLIQDCKKITKF